MTVPVGGARILVVDDDASFRALVRDLLELAGHTVVAEAGDGAEAIRLARELRPDVITMDLDMPILDGASATAELCTEGCAPIVIVSGTASSERVGAALRAGARWHVSKTNAVSQLEAVVAALVNGG